MQNPIPKKITSLEMLFTEAELYANQGLTDEAISIYESIISKNKGVPEELKKKIQNRLKNLAKKPEIQEKPPESLEHEISIEKASGLMQAGFYPEAISELKKLIHAGIESGKIHSTIAEAYLYMGLSFEAAEHFNQALKYTDLPQKVRLEILYRAATLHEKNGAIPQAIETYKKIVSIDPEYRNAHERLNEFSKSAQKYGRFYYLIRKKILSEKQLEDARKMAQTGNKSLEQHIIDNFFINQDDMGRSLSEYYQVPFIEFNELEVGSTPTCIKGIKEHFFKANNCIPIKEHAGSIEIAIDNPNDLIKVDNIKKVLKSSNFNFAVAIKEDIDKFIDYFYGKFFLGGANEDVFEKMEAEEFGEAITEEDEDSPFISETDNIVVQMVNKIIEDAYDKNASDIHVESLTGRRGASIRLRIDGDCMPYQNIPYNFKKALISRIKIISNLDIAEKRLPQDGKIKFRTRRGISIELRVATIPTVENNEDVVLRLLPATEAMPLEKLSLLNSNLENLKRALETPYGLILCVGPTGSGKTTTLHACLRYINTPESKIWTAEDPVEIVQEGLRQVQVKPVIGLTFNRLLRAFLRADPDIIMVGETRDHETATTVIEASLTGHLVFSTLHTNSAPETVTRLLGMGMDPFNFADALICVLAQRLVKRLCSRCKELYRPDKEELELLIKEFGYHPAQPLKLDKDKDIELYKPNGCHFCNNTGYKGRMAIHELLMSSDEMKKLIQMKEPVWKIMEQAMKDGMLTLKQDGIYKVLSGDTDLKQVRAVCIK